MTNQNKLYKCYKDGCTFRLGHQDGIYLSQTEFEEYNKDGQLNCPENNLNCGLQELKPEDYPKPAGKPLNFKLIGAIAAGVLLIGGLVFFFSGKSSDVKTDETAAPPVIETPVVEAPVATPTPAEPVTETVVPKAPAPKAVEEAKPATTKKAVINVATPKGTQTKKFPGGGKYVGEMKNGQMQGLGTFYYGQHELISPRDMKKRYAEAGDYLIGEFYEGKVVSGKLYDSNNTIKEVIMIGR
jgi:hypothetical protein